MGKSSVKKICQALRLVSEKEIELRCVHLARNGLRTDDVLSVI
jgi:hypothetical protein